MAEPTRTRRGGLDTLAECGRRSLESLTGKEVVSVSAAAREGDAWRLSYEVLELARIPETTSVLASYDVVLDDDGEVQRFERTHRYYRNRADEEAL